MKIALIGATGYVGQSVLGEALVRGHYVTALARNPEKLADHSRSSKIKHDLLLDPGATGRILSDHDVIIYTFNPQRQSRDPDIFEQHVRGH